MAGQRERYKSWRITKRRRKHWMQQSQSWRKIFGKGAVMRLGESGAHVAVETVPTGCLSLDLALGLGGVPKGRVIEVYAILNQVVRQLSHFI